MLKIEQQKSNLHQFNHGILDIMICFMQNVKKLNIVGSTALDLQPEKYGGPCSSGLSNPIWEFPVWGPLDPQPKT